MLNMLYNIKSQRFVFEKCLVPNTNSSQYTFARN